MYQMYVATGYVSTAVHTAVHTHTYPDIRNQKHRSTNMIFKRRQPISLRGVCT